MTHPSPEAIRTAKANQERMASIVPSCSYCGDHTIFDRVTHMICPECEAVMDKGAETGASDRDLVLLAVQAFKRATYECAVTPNTEAYEARDRAYVRVVRLLDKALESHEERA